MTTDTLPAADPAAGDQGITFAGLDPVLGSLGELVGLLRKPESAPDPGAGPDGEVFALDPGWFTDPIARTAGGVKSNPQALVRLLAQVLEGAGGQALGVPVKDPALLGTWHPIQNPAADPPAPTGLYFVTRDADEAGDAQVLGLGVYHQWRVPAQGPLLQVDAWGMIPVVRLGGGALAAALAEPGFPITVGIAVEGLDAKPLVDTAGFRFNGVKVSAGLDIAAKANPLQLSLEVLQLQLPGDAAPRDRSLADLEAIPGQQVLETASSLFLAALGQVSAGAEAAAAYLLPALGMAAAVPGQAAQLPLLRWDQLLATVVDGGDPGAPFRAWFQAVASTPQTARAWLAAIAGFAGNPGATVGGDGTRAAPYAAPLLDLRAEKVGVLSLTLGTEVDADGSRRVYPGLDFAAQPVSFGNAPAALRMEAALELAEFTVTGPAAGAAAPELNFDAGFTLANSTPGQPLASVDGYSFGSLAAGVRLGLGPTVVPRFALQSVVTPQASYGTLDLLSPGQLATAAAGVVQGALLELLGIAGASVPFGSNVAALLGVANPAVPAGAAWPADLTGPFTAAQIAGSIHDPLGALAGWYRAVLTSGEQVGGQRAFTLLLQELAALLSTATGTAPVAVTGDGTPSSPWTAALSAAGTTLPAALTGYEVAVSGEVTRLVLGISLGPRLTVGGVAVEPSITAELLSLDLPGPGSSAAVSATWAPRVAAELRLPGGFTTPAVATASLSVDSASLAAGWGRTEGWGWSLFAGNPVLSIGSEKIPVGQDLDFGDGESLEALVLKDAQAFAPVLSGVLGVALLRSQTRAGLALAAGLGLLPDVNQAPGFPAGLAWPASMPRLSLAGLADPRPALRAQLAAVLSDPAAAQAVLSLLAWSAASGDAVPAVAGTGSFDDPWQVPLPAGFQGLAWYAGGAGQAAGVGVGRTDVFTYGTSLRATVQSRLNALEAALAPGAPPPGGDAPGLSLTVTLDDPSGQPLVSLPSVDATLGGLVLGVSCTLSAGALVVEPVVTLLGAGLPGQPVQAQVTLRDFQSGAFTGPLQQAFLTLVNQAVAAAAAAMSAPASGSGAAAMSVSASAAAVPAGFQAAYGLLATLGLAVPRAAETDPYGINPGGWQALLASPTTFASQRLGALLADPAPRSALFALLQQVLGVHLPQVPQKVLVVLNALGLVGPGEQGWPLLPDALLALARNPFATLAARSSALVRDPAARTALVSALAGDEQATFGPFTFGVAGGTSVTLALPAANALDVGGVARISGSVALDLQDGSLRVQVPVYAPTLGLSVVPRLQASLGDGAPPAAFTVQLEWGDGTLPAAPPVTVFPFDSGTFLNQLAEVAPAYVLNVVVSAVVESGLLEQHPLLQELFAGLGIAREEDGTWRMPALLGLLRDPAGWLLSNGVLGQDGRFSLASFGALLSRLPAVKSDTGVAVGPVKDGAQVTGLPYGFGLTATSTAEQAALTLFTGNLEVAGGYGSLEALGLSITLGADAQPGVTGTLTLATGPSFSETPFHVTAGYDRGFALAVGQGAPGAAGGLSLQLVPFPGWGSLLDAASQALPYMVLQEVVPRLLAALQANPGTQPFATALQTLGTQLDVAGLGNALQKVSPVTAQGLEQAALGWLLERFGAAQAPDTAKAVAGLFQGVLPGVTAAGGLVQYQPSPSLPLTLLAGADTVGGETLLGLWAELDLPQSELLRARVSRTGVGVPLTGATTPVFSFGAVVTVPVEGETGPQLSLAYDAARGIRLGIDPLGSAASSSPSTLYRELLPSFFPAATGDASGAGGRVGDWLVQVVTQVLPRYAGAVVLNTPTVTGWLKTALVSGSAGLTPLALLEATSLVVETNGEAGTRYALNTVDALRALTPAAFLGNLLQTLLGTELTLLTFGPGGAGSIRIGPDPADGTRYGVRLQAPDLPLPGAPALRLQLGATDTEWIRAAGGDADALQPGIALYLPITGTGADVAPQFQELELDLVNVGLDFAGSEGRPLVDLARFKLGAVKPRALVRLRLGPGSPSVSFGAGATLQAIGISLAPNALASGADTNPIAQSLLGSGTGAAQDNPPANPTFSVSAAYAGEVWVELRSDDGTGQGHQVVLPVQRSFGPLYVGSVGIGWEDAERILEFLFTGSVALAGLEASVVGLTVGVPVTTPTDFSRYQFDLQGLDVSFEGGPVTMSSALLKTTDPLSYTGAALVKASRFSVVAIGSYTTVDTGDGSAPSLFVFGALQAPLGGVPAFFVTGVAAGFAYNRGIVLPAVGDVQSFPLVSGLVSGTFTAGDDPAQALAKLGSTVPPRLGQYWLAAGLTFTSFELLNSVALLFLSFGRDWEIGLVGLTTLAMPPRVERSVALAYVEMAFKVTIRPTEGVIQAEAQLTPNSFVLAQDCKLTGGFAFYLWLKDVQGPGWTAPAGTFVVTLGGYHPAFVPPPYFPVVPRLGFNWLIDAGGGGSVSVSGGAYFALVPTAVMAGGYLRVVFEAGPLRAWLDAYANFLIEWKPFWYEADVGVSVGVAFQTEVLGVTLTLKAELGADLYLAGPPTHGQVHVSWYVISFTIPFGDQSTPKDHSLTWAEFETSFLPAPAAPTASTAPAAAKAFAAPAAAPADARQGQQVLKLNVQTGLLQDGPPWVVRAFPFALRVDTAVPVSTLTVTGSGGLPPGAAVGVRPMGMTAQLDAPLTVTVTAAGEAVNLAARQIALDGVLNGSPAALWGQSPLDRAVAPSAEGMVLSGTLVGLLITAQTQVVYGAVGPFDPAALAFDEAPVRRLPYADTPIVAPPAAPYPQAGAFATLRGSIMDAAVAAARDGVYAALRAAKVAAPAAPDLTVMASAADLVMQAPPVLAPVNVFQTGGQPGSGEPLAAPAGAAKMDFAAVAARPAAPEVLGLRRRWRMEPPAAAAFASGAAAPDPLPSAPRFTERWVDASHGARTRPSPALAALRARAGSDEGAAQATLHEGTLALWKVDPAAPHTLAHQGELPARATCFDVHGELIADLHVAPGAAAALPAGTGRVAVQGAAPSTGPVGWRAESALTRVHDGYALGDGFALRTQNLSRLRRHGRRAGRGTVPVSELLAGNQAMDRGGTRPGWVETVFHRPLRTFVVAIEGGTGAPGERVRVCASLDARPGACKAPGLTPTSVEQHGAATLLTFSLPEPAADAGHLNVLVLPLSDRVRLRGVFARPSAPAGADAAVADAPHPHALFAAALSPHDDEPPAARVTLSAGGAAAPLATLAQEPS
jgi:hypothetical protein